MKKSTFLFTIAATGMLLAGSPKASALTISPSVVTPLDTFTLAVAGFNTTDGTGILLTNVLTGTFDGLGTAQTFAAAAVGAQTVTITTTQTVGATTTTDTITVGVPTNFIPTGTTTNSGAVINDIELDFGEFNGGANTLDFLTPVLTPTYSGFIKYGTNGASTLNLTNLPTASTLSNNASSLAYYEAVSTTGAAGLTGFAIKTFSYSITYASVPEPSTWAMLGLGLVVGAVVVRRQRMA